MSEDYLEKATVWTILDLIVAEFKSDPMATQCFDAGIVARAIALNQEWKAVQLAAEHSGANDWAVADRVSDEIMDVLRAELEKPDFVPLQAFAGQCLAMLGFLRCAPPERPTGLVTLESRIRATLYDMGVAKPKRQ